MQSLECSSPVFTEGGKIPLVYTGFAEELSPPLELKGVAEEAKSIVLITDDPDAPLITVTHWVLWNIPPETTVIPESIPHRETVEALGGANQGINIARRHAYLGPKPPFGTHRYRFKVYTLDTKLSLPPRASRKHLEKAMQGHILQQAMLVGTFSRKDVK